MIVNKWHTKQEHVHALSESGPHQSESISLYYSTGSVLWTDKAAL